MEGNEHEYETIDEHEPPETEPCGVKACEDWCGNDRIDAVWWGVLFILAALVLITQMTGYSAGFSWWNGWAVLFIGAGLMALVATLVRLGIPEYRRKWAESLIWGLILLAIGTGIGGWTSWNWIWVLVLVAIGIKIVTRATAQRR